MSFASTLDVPAIPLTHPIFINRHESKLTQNAGGVNRKDMAWGDDRRVMSKLGTKVFLGGGGVLEGVGVREGGGMVTEEF